MFANASDWLLLLVDVSLKAMLLAVLAGGGLALFRVSNTHVRHRVWSAMLLGMLVMPLLVQIVPGLSIPVPVLAIISESGTDGPDHEEHTPSAVDGRYGTDIAPLAGPSLAVSPSAAPLMPSEELPSAPPPKSVADSSATEMPGGSSTASAETGILATALSLELSFRTLLRALAATYVCVATILTLRLLLGVLRAGSLIRSSSPIVDGTGLSSGAANGVLRESRLIRVPITVGFFQPRVLLPEGWRAWSREKRNAVLQHELTHIARGDYAVNLLAECNRCLYWFHPLAWWLIRRLSDLAERSCDDAVIAATGDRTSYARHLLEIAATAVKANRRTIQPGVSMARSADVETRIDAILDVDRPLSKRLGWKSTVGLVIVVLPAFWLAAGLRAEAPAKSETDAIVEPADSPDPVDDANSIVSAKVSGRVVDDQGKPVSNAFVSLVLYSHEPERERDPTPTTTVWAASKSAGDGGFSLEYPAITDPEYYTKRAQRLVTIAQKDGLALGWKYVEFSDNATTAEIKLPRAQVRRGRLVGLEGQAIAGATIHVVGVGKPAPRWMQFRRYPVHHGMPPDETTDTNIPVDEKEQLWPHLIRFRQPPFDVRSWLKSVTSDENGLFEIRGVGPDQIVEIHAYGTEQGGTKDHSLGSGSETEPVTLLMDTPRTITGVVKDEVTGKPIAGAKVRVDGTLLIMAKLPVLADWKGRQDHIGNLHALQGNNNMFDGPAVFATTDEEGRYRLSAFGPRYGQPNFVLTVSSPEDGSYLSSRKWIAWPKKATFLQKVDLQLTPGVRVAGLVVSADGKPVARARVDFWSHELPYPYEDLAKPFLGGGFKLSPDGVQHPHWRKADGQGRFKIIVPHGESYVFVNQGTDETVVDRVAATEVGLPEREVRISLPGLPSILPPEASVEPHRFYPDRAVPLNYAADKESDAVTIQLHQKAPTLTVEVVQPDGTPANNLIYMGGQAPFRYYALKLKRLMKKIGDNKFSITCCDLQRPISLAFLARGSGLGLHTEIAAEDIGTEVVTLKLQPLGQAKARFVDKDNKPLNAFRPLTWMSLPRTPFSTAADLEQQTEAKSQYISLQQPFDSVWTNILHKHTHGSLRTGADGNATFKALIPGAIYRISKFDGQIKDFTLQPGETVDLGDIVVFEPERTEHLPGAEVPAKAEAAEQREPNEDQATLRGRVLDPGGKPLVGATLWLSTIEKALGQSDNDGQFQFRVPTVKLRQLNVRGQSESAQLAATADGLGFDFANVGTAADSFELKLCEDLPIRGRFVDSEGNPIQGVEILGVRVFEPGEAGLDPFIDHIRSGNTRFYDKFDKFWTGPVPGGPAVMKVDQQGQLSVTGCGAGRFILFEFTAAGIADDSVYVLTHDAEPIRFKPSRFGVRLMPRLYYGASFTHVTTPSRRINGVVFDKETNKPIAGATVHRSFGTSPKTDAEGRYVLEGHPKSEGYRVFASAGFPYFSSSNGVQDTGGLDPVTVNVYLTRGIGAHGKILDAATGDPIAGRVQYYPLFRDSPIVSGPDFPSTATVEADGSFKLPVLSGPGVLAVRAAEVDAYLSSDLTPKRIDDFFHDGHERFMKDRLMTAGPEGSFGILAPAAYNALILINPKGDQQEVVNEIRLERLDAGG
jgi:beta-lactamase regulating signal transducer with metallopeptidase domain